MKDIMKKAAALCAAVLMAVGCAACSGGGEQTQSEASGEPATSEASEPVTLQVYLAAQYADPTVHYPIYEALMDYQEAHPNLTLEFISPKGVNYMEEREAMISQLNAEILSGGGPDLFIMEGYRTTEINLFPDIEKAMVNGTFLDLTEAMEKQGLSREEDFYVAVLDAGQWEGKQYILPLGFSVPLMVSAADVLNASSFNLQRASRSFDGMLSELLRIHQEQPILVNTAFRMTDILAQPIVDYQEHTVNIGSDAYRRALELDKIFRTGSISWEAQGVPFDNRQDQVLQQFEAGTPFAVLYETDISMNLLRRCEALGIEITVLPVPNEEGTVTAYIGSYAMGNRNTQHPDEVEDLLLYLVSEECQSAAAYADHDQIPVRRGCLQACLEAQYQFSVYDASREKLTDEDIQERERGYGVQLGQARVDQLAFICDQVTAAHYQTVWYNGMDLGKTQEEKNVLGDLLVRYWNDKLTLDELIEILTPKLRLYLDE